MTYPNIRFIAYALDTMPPKDSDGKQSYLGVPAVPADALHTADIDARCGLMLRAMQTAAARLPTSSPPLPPGSVLNVFMAPEFFFRGPLGAYSMEEVQLVITRLQTITATPDWSDWLFVFGSILGFSSPTFDTPPYAIDPSKPKEVYNFTLTQLGGPGNADGIGANVVVKELQSGCDFIAGVQGQGSQLIGNVNYIAASAYGPGREQQQLDYNGAAIFTQQDITWGVEICLDHYTNIGATGRLQRSPQLPGDRQIQVQLVPSGGMSIQQLQTMAMPGGYIFNCDGAAGGSATLAQVNPAGRPPAFSLSNIPAANTCPVDNGPIALPDSSPPPVPASVASEELFAGGAGKVILFAPVATPAPATVRGHVPPQPLTWPASEAYQFDFQLVYDEENVFVAALCKIRSPLKNFGDRSYFLPLSMKTKDINNQDISFNIHLDGPAGNFSNSIRCQVVTRDFSCDGIFLLFNDRDNGTSPLYQVAW